MSASPRRTRPHADSTATISVTVDAAPPVAVNDTASSPADTPVTIDVLATDTPGSSPLDPTSVVFPDDGSQPAGSTVSPDGKTLTVPGEGTYVIDPATGEVTFTPEPGFTGPATPVTYQVTDENGLTDTATIAITIDAPPPAPSLSLVKSATLIDGDGDGAIDVDEVIEYSFAVTNTGNVPIDAVVSDPMLGGLVCTIPGLAPAFTGTCGPVAYTVTAADVAEGTVTNVATAVADDGNPDTQDPSSTDTVTIDRPDVSVVKMAALVDGNGNGLADAGETINYGFQITNSGAVALTDVVLTDPLLGGEVCRFDAMAPGGVETCGPWATW